jgi:hypothetical protein
MRRIHISRLIGDFKSDPHFVAVEEGTEFVRFRNAGAKPAAETPPQAAPEHGLGTCLKKGIDLTTLGCGQKMFSLLTKLATGKNCRCNARRRCLDELVPDVRMMTVPQWADLVVSPQLFKCLRVKEQS